MAKKSKKGGFKNKVTGNTKQRKSDGSSYGYLVLPNGVSMFKAPPGERASLDFMPYLVSDKKHPDRNEDLEAAMEGTEWYKRPFKVHKNIGADNDSVVCLTSFGKKCPICEYRAKLQQEGADKDELKPMNSSKRNLYCVIPKKVKDYEEIPYIFDMSAFLYKKLLDDELEEDEENGIFPDLEEGKTLRIRFDSDTFAGSKPYATASRIDFEDRKKPYSEKIRKGIPDLDKVLKELSYKEVSEMFFDGAEEPEEKEGKSKDTFSEKPKRKKKTAKADDAPDDKKKKKCPHDHKFGKDTEKFEECDKCELWKACLKAKKAKKK